MNANVTLPNKKLLQFSALAKNMGPAGAKGHDQGPWTLGRKPGKTIAGRIFPERDMKQRKESFKLGFLSKIAECGLTPKEFFAACKTAFLDPMGVLEKGVGLAGTTLGHGADLAGSALGTLGTAAVAAPVAIGGASGVLRELLETPPVEDVDLLRRMEQLGLYRRLTKEIRGRMASRGA